MSSTNYDPTDYQLFINNGAGIPYMIGISGNGVISTQVSGTGAIQTILMSGSMTGTLPISVTNNNVSITTASTSTSGSLTSTDWNTFNDKQPAGTYNTTIATSGLGVSLINTGGPAVTQILNSISGLGTVTLSGPTNGVISISGSAYTLPLSIPTPTTDFGITTWSGTSGAGLRTTVLTASGTTLSSNAGIAISTTAVASDITLSAVGAASKISLKSNVSVSGSITQATAGSNTLATILPFNNSMNIGDVTNQFANVYASGVFQNTSQVISSGIGLGGVTVTKSAGTLTISGTAGDVVGPASATNYGVATFNGTTGKLIRDTSTILASGSVLNIGTTNITTGAIGLVVGTGNTIDNTRAYAFGSNNRAMGQDSMAVGQTTTASGMGAFAEGAVTLANGNYSHAEGGITRAMNYCSHAEGLSTSTSGNQAHAEGELTFAIGTNSHAQGSGSVAFADMSHAEGLSTTAYGNNSHAQGQSTIASGLNSFAGGFTTKALGVGSVALGYNAIASASGSWIFADTVGASQTNSVANSLAMRFAGGVALSGTVLTTNSDISGNNIYGVYNQVNGRPIPFQSPRQNVMLAPLAAATVQGIGCPLPTIAATLSQPAWSTSFGWSQNIATSTVVNNNAGFIGTAQFAYISGTQSATNQPVNNGIEFRTRFCTPDASYAGANGCRILIGLTSQGTPATAVGSDNPAGNYMALQYCTASGSARQDTVFRLFTKDSTTQATGSMTLAPIQNCIYDFYMSLPNTASGASPTITWRLDNITSGTSAQGTTTANIPLSNTALLPMMHILTAPSGAGVARNLKWTSMNIAATV